MPGIFLMHSERCVWSLIGKFQMLATFNRQSSSVNGCRLEGFVSSLFRLGPHDENLRQEVVKIVL